MERETKQKRGRYRVGNKIKMLSNVGSVIKIESRNLMSWKSVSVNYCTNISSLGNLKTLRDKLVCSKFKLTDDADWGNFPCGIGNCEICNILKPGKDFKITVTWLNL